MSACGLMSDVQSADHGPAEQLRIRGLRNRLTRPGASPPTADLSQPPLDLGLACSACPCMTSMRKTSSSLPTTLISGSPVLRWTSAPMRYRPFAVSNWLASPSALA